MFYFHLYVNLYLQSILTSVPEHVRKKGVTDVLISAYTYYVHTHYHEQIILH